MRSGIQPVLLDTHNKAIWFLSDGSQWMLQSICGTQKQFSRGAPLMHKMLIAKVGSRHGRSLAWQTDSTSECSSHSSGS
jgi:hypothetical protein